MAECLESTGSTGSFAGAPSIVRIIDAIFNGKNEKSRSKTPTLFLMGPLVFFELADILVLGEHDRAGFSPPNLRRLFTCFEPYEIAASRGLKGSEEAEKLTLEVA